MSINIEVNDKKVQAVVSRMHKYLNEKGGSGKGNDFGNLSLNEKLLALRTVTAYYQNSVDATMRAEAMAQSYRQALKSMDEVELD